MCSGTRYGHGLVLLIRLDTIANTVGHRHYQEQLEVTHDLTVIAPRKLGLLCDIIQPILNPLAQKSCPINICIKTSELM